MRMAGSARLLRALLRALITGLVALAAGSQLASAQTPDQIEAFRNLPPDQQQAVLKSMSGQGSSGVDDQARAQDAVEPVVPMDGAQRESLQPTLQPSPPRAAARGTVVLAVTTNTDVSDADRATIVGRREQILAHNPYSLDEEGRLHLPFLAPIALGGLTDKEAALRLNADPRLAGLTFVVTLLPVAQIGIEALKPFGYDLFAQRPERFARASGTALATPADYSVGPGDQINIDLFGKKTRRYRLVVNRDGSLTIPELRPPPVSGMSVY